MAGSRPIHALQHPIAVDPALGEIARETGYAAHVDQMIRQVLFTAPGERVDRPDFGCGLRRMVFAPNSEAGASLLKVQIRQALDKWLGTLIRVTDVVTQVDGEVLRVTVVYLLKARQERRYLNLEVAL
jgi:phage baseplate assembly protein W